MKSNVEPVEPFDYEQLDTETRALVLRVTGETQHLVRRTAEAIIAIGQNLRLVQAHLPDLSFSAWLRAEFAWSRQTAYNYIRVATRLADRCPTVLHLPARVLYELAASSDELIDQVEAGILAPTLPVLRAARAAEKQAHSAQEQAKAQQATIDALAAELEITRQQFAELAVPPIELREIERVVIPAELTAQLEALQQASQALSTERDTLARQVGELQEHLAAVSLARQAGAEEQRVRLSWYRMTSEFQRSVRTLLAQWPSPLDTLVFEAEDWNRLAQLTQSTRRVLDACQELTQASSTHIVDSSSEQQEEEKE